jgi:hypothetical protein
VNRKLIDTLFGGTETRRNFLSISVPNPSEGSNQYSRILMISLWISLCASFLVIHVPKDTISGLSQQIVPFLLAHLSVANSILGNTSTATLTFQSLVLKTKGIVFLASLIVLFIPVIRSLHRHQYLWETQTLMKRLLLSALIFVFLSLLIDPLRLSALHHHYSQMSISPFDVTRGWYYRRLLMPAIAYFLGFQGGIFYYIYSTALTYALIFFLLAYVESESIKLNFLHLFSIATTGFVIFNFMVVGWAEPMMFILFLLLLLVADDDMSRLSLVALALAAHEGSVFVLLPMILFWFPKKGKVKYLAAIALYFFFYFVSFRLNALMAVKSQFTLDNKMGLDWAMLYPWRTILGWFLSYKLLWIIIALAIYRMVRAKDFGIAMAVICFSIVAPGLINLLAVDVYRHVAEGFCGLLISYTYLMRLGYGDKWCGNLLMAINILIPSVYVGANSGFRFKPGLYLWLCNVTGLHGWLAKF